MKIKIKSREEIGKTLNKINIHIDGSSKFNPKMFSLCGKVLDAIPIDLDGYKAAAGYSYLDGDTWGWHPDWYEVIELDFTEEDIQNIELMDEMLGYFLGSKIDTREQYLLSIGTKYKIRWDTFTL